MARMIRPLSLVVAFIVLNVAFMNCSMVPGTGESGQFKSNNNSNKSGGAQSNGGGYNGKFVRLGLNSTCGVSTNNPDAIIEWINGAYILSLPQCNGGGPTQVVQPRRIDHDPYHFPYSGDLFYQEGHYPAAATTRVSLQYLCVAEDYETPSEKGISLAVRVEHYGAGSARTFGQLVIGSKTPGQPARLVDGTGHMSDVDSQFTAYFGPGRQIKDGGAVVDWNDERSFEAFVYDVRTLDQTEASGLIRLTPSGVEIPAKCYLDRR